MRTAAFWGIPSRKKRNPVNDAFRRMAGFNCHSRALCVLLVLGGLTSSAFAAVEYVRDIVMPVTLKKIILFSDRLYLGP